jgi:glycosyltransferase involved in cell wall biosynthesis
VIYVSGFLAKEEPLDKPSHILWNAIEDDFMNKAIQFRKPYWKTGQVLMVASLKQYKGVDEFVVIAKACHELHFDLVVNASENEITKYFSKSLLPSNLTIHPAQQNVHPFYQRADVVMNLSRPDEWKETFGLTALEAMIYGLPVIVPPVGGISEIVHDCLTGFHFNGKDTKSIVSALRALSTDPILFQNVSRPARAHAASFSERRFLDQSLQIIKKASPEKGGQFQKMEHFQ